MTNATMYITVGLPASGKTGWAMERVRTHPGTVNVNRDDLRMSMFGVSFGPPIDENEVTWMQHQQINIALKRNKDVIVSDTNLTRKFVVALTKLAHNWGARVEFVYFPVNFDELVRRDNARAANGQRAVGEDVIRKFQSKLPKGKLPDYSELISAGVETEPYNGTPGKPDAIIVDLDGTVALHDRSPYDYDSLHTDRPNKPVIDCVWAEYRAGTRILFTSGRPDSHYDMTAEWINDHIRLGVDGDRRVRLFMRRADDKRMDAIVKREIFDEKIRDNFNVKYCFDDRDQVVEAWRRMGLTVFQVAPGNF